MIIKTARHRNLPKEIYTCLDCCLIMGSMSNQGHNTSTLISQTVIFDQSYIHESCSTPKTVSKKYALFKFCLIICSHQVHVTSSYI